MELLLSLVLLLWGDEVSEGVRALQEGRPQEALAAFAK